MKKHIYSLFVLMVMATALFSQDNLSVSLDNVPGFLNVCGDADSEMVTISLNGASPDARTNIQAAAVLFKGVVFDSFDGASSSPGITVNAADPTRPVFSIPDLSPGGTTSVEVVFSVKSNCEYIDTLRGGSGVFDVLDTWEFTYDMGGSTGLTESDQTIEYRDALAFPIFVLQMDNSFGPTGLGDCFSRTLEINNTGVAGFVDSLVYENTQGAGVYVASITVNGIPLVINKTADANGDTIISAGIGPAYFMANINGDGDGFFDPNESLQLVENVCMVDCDGDRTSLHNISWGCEGQFCETIEENDFVEVGLGAADIVVAQLDFLTDQNAGYCQQGITTLTFTNIGIEADPGFATMLDVAAGINFLYDLNTGVGQLQDGAFEITGVEIAGVAISSISDLISLDNNPQFLGPVDPDGPGGLSDFDGDGYFDDLETGQSIKVRAFYDFDCSNSQLPDNSCSNDISTSFNGIMEYNDLCGNALVRRNLGYQSTSHVNVDEEIIADPDANLQTDTFYITYRQNRQVTNFAKNCSNDEEYLVSVVLPSGVNIIPDVTELRLSGVDVATLKSSTISNDTLYMVFDAAQNPLGIPLQHELTLALQADCSADVGETTFPMEFAHYCGDCDCKHTWYCGILPGPWLHTTDPPCSPPQCPYGLGTRSFSVERTTLGYTDNSFSTLMDVNDVNTKAGLPCDSVSMTINTVVGDAPLTDSIGMVITYNNPDETLNPVETFVFAQGLLRIDQGGVITNCPVSSAALTTTMVDSTKVLTFDLDDCLITNGITLNPGDSVVFVADFTINPNGAFPTTEFTEVPNLRGYAYAIDQGTTFICDSFGEEFEIGGLETFVAFPNSSTLIQGCGEVELSIKITPNLNEYIDRMGFEHRQALRVDSVAINFDVNIFESFDKFDSQVSFPGHPFHGNNSFDLPAFTDFPNGRYVVYFDTLNWGPSLIDALSTNGFNFTINVVPNCQTSFGALGGGDDYVFNPELYYIKNAYALEYGDGSCAETFSDQNIGTLSYVKPPKITMNPVTNPNYTLLQDIAEWTVIYCNPDIDRDIGFTWLSIEDTLGGIEIVSVEDISIPGNPDTLAFKTYGPNNEHFVAYSEGLLRSDGSNSLAETCNTIRFRARVNRCGTTNFTANAGWNCLPPADPNWTPDDYDPCTERTLDLSVVAMDPFLDADLIGPPSDPLTLCDTNTVEILVKNTQQGTAYDIASQIILPLQGATLVGGSVEIAYPANGTYVPALSDPVFAGTNNKGNIYEYNDFSQLNSYLDSVGLQGFDANADPDSSRFQIRYQFTTDCDFRSGSIAFYSFEGVKGCGEASNTESGETIPMEIDGVPPSNSNAFDIFFDVSSVLTPGDVSTVEIIVVNQSTVVSDEFDKVNIQLPVEIEYIPGSETVITPGSWVLGVPEMDTINATIQDLIWDLPIGMMQNDTARFSFEVNTPTYDCSVSSLQVGLYTLVRTTINCSATMSDCLIESVTSTNGGAFTDLPVQQNVLLLNNTSFTSTCLSNTHELVAYTGNLLNLGDPIGASPIVVHYYLDLDGSGTYEATEPEYINFAESGPLATGEALNFSHSFPVPLANLCDLLVYVDTTGLGLCQPVELGLGVPQLENAGEDELYCTVDPIIINTTLGDPACTGLTGYTYTWTAVAPASTADLSATNIANPSLSVPHQGITEDTLIYILETTKPACGTNISTRDTVHIVRGLGFELNPVTPVFVSAGDSVMLSVPNTGGTAPFTYEWSPGITLTDSTIANPEAFPTVATDYMVTVTSASGCSEITTVQVLMGNPINGTVNVSDSTICPGDTIQLIASGGTDYLWEADMSNPTGGILSATNIANPTFTSDLAGAVYNYDVIISDTNVPGFTDTVELTIRVDDIVASATYSQSGIGCTGESFTLNGSGGLAQDWYTGGALIGSGPSLEVFPTMDTDYTLVVTNANGCTDTAMVTVNVLLPPEIITSIIDQDNCNGDTTRVSMRISEVITDYEILGTGNYTNVDIMGSLISFDAIYTGNPTSFDVILTGTSNACSVSETFVINACPCVLPTINSVMVVEASCDPLVSGLVTINLTQDNSNYSYTWTPDLGNSSGVGNIRTGLPAGGYQVEIAQLSTLGCSEVIDVAVSNSDGPDATYTTTDASCGAADGSVTFVPDTLTYEWPDGSFGDTRNDLTSGSYIVTITDPADPSCPNFVLVEVEEDNTLTADVVINTYPDCTSSTGSATINVTGGSGNYAYSWSSGTDTQTGLAMGVYVVTVTDNGPSNCELEVVVVVPAGNLVDVNITDTTDVDCAGQANGSIDFSLLIVDPSFIPADTIITNGTDTLANGTLPEGNYCVFISDASGCIGGASCFDIEAPDVMDLLFVITPACPDDGAIDLTVNGGTEPYNFDWIDLTGSSDPEDRTGLVGGNYGVDVTDANGCAIAEYSVIVPDCPTIGCDYFFGQDSVELQASGCDDLTNVCMDVPTNLADQFAIYDNGVLFTGQLEGCIFDSQFTYNYGGVLSTPPYDIEWTVNGETYSATVNSEEEIVDSMNVWDPTGDWEHIDLASTILGGNGNNTYSALTVTDGLVGIATPLNYVLSQTPLSLGMLVDTGFHMIVLTDTVAMCSDTLYANITCPVDNSYNHQTDSVCMGSSIDFYIDTTRLHLTGDIVSVTPGCDDANGESVDFDLDTQTMILTYTGATPGLDTACYEFLDVNGVRDTIFFYITSIECNTGLWVCDSVFIFQTKEYCPDTTVLGGPVDRFENLCPELGGTEVEFFLNPETKCVEYTGLALGMDTACVVLCDEFGFCDTTYFCINVLPYFDPPIAMDDYDTTDIGTPVVIDIKANDILFGGVDTAYILTPPLYGTIGTAGNLNQLNLDCSVTYNAGDEFCEREDQFEYVVCTPNGCDTATVYVWLECSDIVIFTAVSPNGDGVNDFFHIAGIDAPEFADNKLMIYNRWGNLVFETVGYQNNWDGTWKNNKEVPDGTYYYILELNDDEGRVFNGYLELYR